jgi:MscS family membrane protein
LKKIEKAIKIIKNAIKTTDGTTDAEPLVTFHEFGDFSLQILVIYWIKSFKYYLSVRHEVDMKIKKGFEKAGIDFAFPTQTIYVENAKK